MYYFIPAWYGQGVEFWQPDMTPWYNRRKKIDFDDNMYECLLDIYKYFNTDVISQKYKDEIKDFSNEMNLYL